ncbi:hypothetical protein [Sinorhizobium psoraleae]|uniref:Transposase n=1 Tax=Sinorhizobium psoraleae TaxID=520838 RepID=A0ABT4KN97_9HYPH|nr:hypothetical protein [Sinorhizobium psoraleae]MCZ4093431.1 hypothetical protein [Sinorhizobium psoraleae]
MRGYLAARWAALEDASPVTLLEKTEKIWRLGRDDQIVVWEFFAEMIEPEVGKEIWLWATKSPERVLLQHALQKRGKCRVVR